ncbi:MAG: aldehyde dehydrogenase family protein [Planctomycetes bacterium]|nr:aldehyde dehydrogenase family protein [Planctomycetota bacterium]
MPTNTTTDRLDILKTYKLFIDGKFPRSESGRTTTILNSKGQPLAYTSRASRKDLREAVESARRAQATWASSTAYLRAQIIYRIAEMLEGRRAELIESIHSVAAPIAKSAKKSKSSGKSLTPAAEVAFSIDRLVHYAGWADKFSQVLGCNNPVAGPHYNFTVPEPTGVVAVIAPDQPPLLGLVSLLAPVICSGNATVLISSQTNPLPAVLLGEILATSDVPAGVVNILTGDHAELIPFIAGHRDIDAVHGAASGDSATTLRAGSAENIKRVVIRDSIEYTSSECESAWWIEPFVEMKTIWHPASA